MLTKLTHAIRHHIERILPTLAYARSQHNNHILSEALGLMVGGDFLRGNDPRAEKWIKQGLQEFERVAHDIGVTAVEEDAGAGRGERPG